MSQIKGGEGNIEYLIRLKREGNQITINDIEDAVNNAKERYQKNENMATDCK